MITLADLRARNTLPSWQEAVAIVQELFHATVAARGSAARLPDIDHIALADDGTITLLPGGSIPADRVRHLAVITELLLEDVSAPPELIDIVQRNATDPPESRSVEELIKALAFFERPGRRVDIARLVQRASLAAEQTRADEELRRLKARTAQVEKPAEEAKPRPATRRRSLLVPLAAAAVVIVVLGTAAVSWWVARTRASQADAITQTDAGADAAGNSPSGETGAGSAPAKNPSLLSRVSDAVRAAASSFGASAPPPEVVPPPPVLPAAASPHLRSRRTVHGSPKVSPNAPADVSDTESDPMTIITTELGGRPLEPEPATASAVAIDAEAVYSARDLSVLPPTIVRPVIPPPPAANAPPDSVALFDVLVDRRGRVEQVQVASEPSRFHERMILAHVKSWTFQPAMKEGRPVRYRLRV